MKVARTEAYALGLLVSPLSSNIMCFLLVLPAPSSLYGCSGESWDKGTGRLLDWSYAGYMYGDYNPPQLPWLANIKAVFGAKGDGVSDDTAAFEYAVSTIASEGALLIPAGTYVITRVRTHCVHQHQQQRIACSVPLSQHAAAMA